MKFGLSFLVLFVSTATVLAQSSNLLTGQWHGTWQSDRSGHSGPLNARMIPRQDGSVRVIYTGRFAKIIPFRYGVTFRPVTVSPNLATLQGQSRLGPIFGTFDYSATVTPTLFDARYSARKDFGRFVLHRNR